MKTPSGRCVLVPEPVRPVSFQRGPRISPWLRFRQCLAFELVERSTALLLLLSASPLFLLIYGLVRLTSRGPGFYKQTRIGRRGARFDMVKFRSMRSDAERATGPVWCQEDDDRITAVGRFLRRTHLDELPQLWNVLRGDMSFIGPRPERPHFVEVIGEAFPHYGLRHAVKPGVTGLAQVRFRAERQLKDSAIKASYDLLYLDRSSPFLDLRILVATVLPPMIDRKKL